MSYFRLSPSHFLCLSLAQRRDLFTIVKHMSLLSKKKVKASQDSCTAADDHTDLAIIP